MLRFPMTVWGFQPDPQNPDEFNGGWGVRPIGKSISVSVRVVRDVRAGGRGEAARVRVGRYPQRWAFRELGSTWSAAVGAN